MTTTWLNSLTPIAHSFPRSLMDQLIIWVGVSLVGPHVAFAAANGKLWAMGVKLFSQVVVILSNYVFSKLFIFKKK